MVLAWDSRYHHFIRCRKGPPMANMGKSVDQVIIIIIIIIITYNIRMRKKS
jgi:hypothetical protein